MRRLPAILAGAVFLAAGAANADTWRFNPAISVTSTLSTNPGFRPAGLAEGDLVVTTTPSVVVQGTGAGYRLAGSIGADATAYVKRTQPDRLWPNVHLDGQIRVVDRLAYVDGALDAASQTANPLTTLADVSTNRAVYYRQRVSPYLEREIAPGRTVLARSDNTFIQTRNGIVPGLSGNSFLQSNLIRFESRPQPFGLRADWTQSTSEFLNVAGSRVVFDAARLNLLWAPSPDLTLGVVGGSDRGSYSTNNVRQVLKGVTLRWAPTPRTALDARVEDRFFGTGWDVSMSHRSPFIAFSGELYKRPITYASQVALLTAGTDVAGLLDAALQTRIPNPIDRATAVQNIITQRGLPVTLANSAVLYSGVAGLQERAAASVALLGGMHTVTLRVFRQRNQDLLSPTDTPPIISSDALQIGGSLNVTRRLSSVTSATASVTRVAINGFGVNQGRESHATGLRLSYTQNLDNRTAVTGGLRVQQVSSNSQLVTSADETAVFAGLSHQF